IPETYIRLKNFVCLSMRNKTEFWTTLIKVFAVLSIVFGLIFFIIAIYKFSTLYDVTDGTGIDMSGSGQIGDFIGGILGPIWSLTGILLFYIALKYQRDDLNLQLDELKSTR